MPTRSLEGMTAVITGASSGIGEAAARMLAQHRVKLMLTARRLDKIEALAASLGKDVLAVAADIGDRRQVASVFQTVRESFGGLDLLFNNAGIGYGGRFSESDPTEWRKVIDTNLYGVLNCTWAAIPLLRGRPGAMISTVASVAGRHGVEDLAVYSATKFAVVGFHDALRKELGPDGIRISLIEPGAVYTNWGHGYAPGQLEARRARLNAMQPEDIANALLFALAQPHNVNVQELLIMPTRQIKP